MCSGLQLESNRIDVSITEICLKLKNCLLPKKLNWPRYTAFRPKSTKRNFGLHQTPDNLLSLPLQWYIILLARREKCWCETTAQWQKMQLFWDLEEELFSHGNLGAWRTTSAHCSCLTTPLPLPYDHFSLQDCTDEGSENWPGATRESQASKSPSSPAVSVCH